MTIYLLLSLLPLVSVHCFSSVNIQRHASFVTVASKNARFVPSFLASAAQDRLDQMMSDTRQVEVYLDELQNKRDEVRICTS